MAAAMTIDRNALLERLSETDVTAVYRTLGVHNFKRGGDENWVVSCPWREDRDPSMTIRMNDGVWNDHGRDEGGSIFDAVMRVHGLDLPDAIEWVADHCGIVVPNGNKEFITRRIVDTYKYCDTDGVVRYETVRYEPKDFRQRQPNGRGGWIWNLDGINLLLYRLPELLMASQRKWVIVCEGEKDVDLLRKVGFVATTNAMGAGKWDANYTEALMGRRVAILPDNDEPGIKHAKRVAAELHGNAAEVRIIELPGLGERTKKHGKDVTDWFEAGHDALELQQLIRSAPDWSPESGTAEAVGDGGTISREDFRAFMPDHKYIFLRTGDLWAAASVDGRLGLKTSKWLDRNRPVEQMTWAPGRPALIENMKVLSDGLQADEGCVIFNQYIPPTVKMGDPEQAGPWIDHVRRLYPMDADHLIAWLAQRVQHPEIKINHGIVLGGAQGIGKDTVLEPVAYAIGPWNMADISPVQLLGRFNGFLRSVILRVSEARDLGDNERGTNRYMLYEHMKTYMAAPPKVLLCDMKYMPSMNILNICGVIITTNHKTNGIYLPADDRRHYVAWSDALVTDFESDHWGKLYRWYAAGGLQHVAAYLRSYDLSNFDPSTAPPHTPAFWDIVDAGRQPEDSELADIIDALGQPRALTLKDLINRASTELAEYLTDRRNSRVIPHRLESVGYVKVRNPDAKDGQWKIKEKRQAVYAMKELDEPTRLASVRGLVDWMNQ